MPFLPLSVPHLPVAIEGVSPRCQQQALNRSCFTYKDVLYGFIRKVPICKTPVNVGGGTTRTVSTSECCCYAVAPVLAPICFRLLTVIIFARIHIGFCCLKRRVPRKMGRCFTALMPRAIKPQRRWCRRWFRFAVLQFHFCSIPLLL